MSAIASCEAHFCRFGTFADFGLLLILDFVVFGLMSTLSFCRFWTFVDFGRMSTLDRVTELVRVALRAATFNTEAALHKCQGNTAPAFKALQRCVQLHPQCWILCEERTLMQVGNLLRFDASWSYVSFAAFAKSESLLQVVKFSGLMAKMSLHIMLGDIDPYVRAMRLCSHLLFEFEADEYAECNFARALKVVRKHRSGLEVTEAATLLNMSALRKIFSTVISSFQMRLLVFGPGTHGKAAHCKNCRRNKLIEIHDVCTYNACSFCDRMSSWP